MSNKKARQALEKLYGKGCMMERAGIRKIAGVKKQDRQITYHHLRPKRLGGQATVENRSEFGEIQSRVAREFKCTTKRENKQPVKSIQS